MAVNQCENCRFYEGDQFEVDEVVYEQSYGICRRFPPRRLDGTNSGFPFVEDDWWCGEHQKKFDQSVK